jgi:hypothetical protein
MHAGIISFLAIHVATCSAVGFLHKRAANLFNRLMENAMDALGVTALLNLISQMERALILLAASSIFLTGARFGMHLGKNSGGTGLS